MNDVVDQWGILDPQRAREEINAAFARGGGGNTIALTADTDIAAGTTVSINAAGHAVQTFGVAPQFGSSVSVPNSTATTWGILKLDADHFVALISNHNTSTGGAVLGSISGGAIALGTFLTDALFQNVIPNFAAWNSAGLTIGNAAALSASSFVTVYTDSGTNFVTARVYSISGGVITGGTPVQLDTSSSGAGAYAVTAIDATHFAVGWATGGNVTMALCSVSGTTITAGSPSVISAGIYNPDILNIGSSHLLVVYSDSANSFFITAVVATVTGLNFALGTPNATSANPPSTAWAPSILLDATHWVTAWRSDTTGFNVVAAGSISGTTPAWGSEVTTVTQAGGTPFYAALDATHIAVAINNGTPGSAIGSISGNTLALSDQVIPEQINYGINSGSVSPARGMGLTNLAVVSSTSFVVVDGAANVYEFDNIGAVSPPIQHLGTSQYEVAPVDATQVLAAFNDQNSNMILRLVKWNPIASAPTIGLSGSAVTSGNPAIISLSGSVAGFSGLTPGRQYYANGDGTLTAANTGHPMGVALDATHLLAA